MPDKIPLLKAKDVVKVLEKLGFIFKRQKGSHMFFEHLDRRTTRLSEVLEGVRAKRN